MRGVLLFLLLAGGGIALLAATTGGFRGVGRTVVRPEVPVVERSGAQGTGLRLDQLGGESRSLPPAELTGTGAFSTSGKEHATWSDAVTGERIDFPEYVRWFFAAKDSDPVSDRETGEQAILFKDVRVLATKEAATLTHDEARALRADPGTWRNLVRLEVSAAEGRADFLTPRLAAGEKKPPGVRTVVRFTKDAFLHDHGQDVRLRTEEVTVDLEAGAASGPHVITAMSPDWTLVGRGFRLERDTSRLEILEDAGLDLLRLPTEAAVDGTPFESGGSFRPARVRARGGAVVSRRTAAKGSPYEVRLEDRVHVEQDGGRSLDADVVTLTLTRREGGHGSPDPAPGSGAAASPRYRVSRLTADGHVALETPRADSCGLDCLLRISTERFIVELSATDTGLTTFEGPSSMVYRGDLRLPGSTEANGRITATCVERMTYGPAQEGAPAGETVLSLEGEALVVAEPMAGDGATQRLAADSIRLTLRPPPPHGAPPRTAMPARETSTGVGNLVATGFVADGRVRLEGTLLAGHAQRIVAERLDRPDPLVVATGDGVRFVVHQEPPKPRPAGAAGGPSPATPGPAADPAKRPWRLVALEAKRDVRARFADVAGDRPLEFSGDTLTYAPGPGGMLRGDAKRLAHLLLVEVGGAGDAITAPAIGFRLGAEEDRLWTEGPTTSRVRMGAAEPATGGNSAPPPPLAQDLHLLGRSRIEIEGASGTGRDATIRILGQGEIEVRPAGAPPGAPPTHRLAADTVEIGLAQGRGGEGADGLSLFRGSSPRPGAGRGTPGRSTLPAVPALPGAAAATKPAEWTLVSGPVSLAFSPGDRGLREMTAEGGVVATSEAARFQGRRLHYEGAAGRGSLDGGGDLGAVVLMGTGDAVQRVASSRVDFAFDGARVKDAAFRAPVVATLIDADAVKGTLVRFLLRSDADLVLEGDRASTDGPVEVTRTARDKPGADFGAPLVLTTRRIVVVKPDLLGGGAGPVTSMTAEGRGTRVEMGKEGSPDFLRAVGDRLEYDAANSKMTMTGEPDVWVERSDLEGTLRRFVWDPDANLPDIEGAHLRLRRR